jgi:hypothetical protein
MTRFQFRRKLRQLQKERKEIEDQSQQELRAATENERQQLQSEWSNEFFMIQEQIDELQSDYIREPGYITSHPRNRGVLATHESHWKSLNPDSPRAGRDA